MKIEDCKTLPEFFGVEHGEYIWIENIPFQVTNLHIASVGIANKRDGQALVGCLTGQLEWSKHEPMTGDEEDLLREIAAWFPHWKILKLCQPDITAISAWLTEPYPFDTKRNDSKAYEVLAPILEKYGEINLDDYR